MRRNSRLLALITLLLPLSISANTAETPVCSATEASVYTVKAKDKLWNICERCLQTQNLPDSERDINQAVSKVAKDNSLGNPNLIYINQVIKLNSIQSKILVSETLPLEALDEPRQKHVVAVEISPPVLADPIPSLEPELAAAEQKEPPITPKENTPNEVTPKLIAIEPETLEQNGKQQGFLSRLLSPKPKPLEIGLGLGASTLDIGSTSFDVNGQSISVDLDDKSFSQQLFLQKSYNDFFALELSYFNFGSFDFLANAQNGAVNNSFTGDRSHQGLGLGLINTYSFKNGLRLGANVGALQSKIETTGNTEPASSTTLDRSENTTSLLLGLELNKVFWRHWRVGPSVSFIDAGDKLSQVALKVSWAK